MGQDRKERLSPVRTVKNGRRLGYSALMNRASRWISGLLPLALLACGSDATAPKTETASSDVAAGPSGAAAGIDKAPRVTEPDAYEFRLESPRELITRDNAFRVVWFPSEGRIPINEHFTVDVTVTKNDEARTPVEGALVTMSCFMPEHGHGMLREPRSDELGEGKYRVNGFLLHMDGYWTVSVNLLVDGLAATADDELRL